MRVRNAYALLGVLFLILIIGSSYAFNRGFIKTEDTENIISNSQSQPMASTTLSLTSSVFEHNGKIPSKYTCDGDRSINPPLEIAGAPEGTKTLALIMDDPDVPKVKRPSGVFDHWVVFNMMPPPEGGTLEIFEGGPIPGMQGANTAGTNVYTGPCPPPEYEPSEHRYVFKLYALDSELDLDKNATKDDVLAAMNGRILESAELIGRYKRI
ncbi:MAG: PEBP family protein [Parcubacteria group bacterium GW2011_GWA2_51_10]|nr:MAG: PEBP family protein [Parcubacteria group bacterium GW2011_GWA2_51_10]